MKKEQSKNKKEPLGEELLPEYNFKGGIRGKHYKAYQKGHLVKVHKPGGSVSLQYFKLQDGAVILEPDVRRYFPDSDSVNQALRSLIELIPKKRRALKKDLAFS
ncbi:MAG: hypothetical protein HY717_02320 [Planctomycetes bacterium]|nr:hypothetical protein [Planctomycetota bacterium]